MDQAKVESSSFDSRRYRTKYLLPYFSDNSSSSMRCNDSIDRALRDAGIDVSCPIMEQLRPLLKIGHDVNRQFGYITVASICRKCTAYLNNHNVRDLHHDDLLLIWDIAVKNVYGATKLAPIEVMTNLPLMEFEIAVDRRERLRPDTVSKTSPLSDTNDINITLPVIFSVVVAVIAVLVICGITQ